MAKDRAYTRKDGAFVYETSRLEFSDIHNSHLLTPGQTVQVATDEYTRGNNVYLMACQDMGGCAGNCDKGIRAYHGWRGTTDDWARYAHGLREILSVTERGGRVRIVFGPDKA